MVSSTITRARRFPGNACACPVPVASDAEVLLLIESNALRGRGVGYLDMHLLASLRLAIDVRLWTRDERLSQLAGELSATH